MRSISVAAGGFCVNIVLMLAFSTSAYARCGDPATLISAIQGSFNVGNYFNGDGLGGGFPTSRGADNYSEFQRQSMKLGCLELAIVRQTPVRLH